MTVWYHLGQWDRHFNIHFFLFSAIDIKCGQKSGTWRIRSIMGQLRSAAMIFTLVFMSLVVWTKAQGPIPAADIPTQCNSVERCCMPTPYTGTPGIRQFELNEISSSSWRVRRPAHLLRNWEVARLEKAYALIRALPDSDPRSLLNQMNIHCLYCDNALYYPGQEYPLEIHDSWFFLPWHRMFLYWHERILAKVLEDDSFALPFWAWDSTETTDPLPNTMPVMYADPSSSLWNLNRNNCSYPPFLIDLDNRGGGCNNKTEDFIRVQNERLIYSQLVTGAPTTALMYGLPYYFGDYGGKGPGTFEDSPHGPVHAWVGDPNAQPPLLPLDDMGNFGRAAFDPIFYPHHANMDRVWEIWHGLPGGVRTIPNDAAFNASQFTFYDENANLVKMNVSQALDITLLRYKYEYLPAPWVTNGVSAGEENTVPQCNPMTESAVKALISNTSKHTKSQVLGETPITFRVTRPKKSSQGTEILEISGIRIPNATARALWKAYVFYPQATAADGPACPEHAGTFSFLPHVGQAEYNPKRVWRMAVGPKLVQLGKDYVKSLVVTLVQTTAPPGQNITFTGAKIFYDLSPRVTI